MVSFVPLQRIGKNINNKRKQEVMKDNLRLAPLNDNNTVHNSNMPEGWRFDVAQPPYDASPPSYVCPPYKGDIDMRGRCHISPHKSAYQKKDSK